MPAPDDPFASFVTELADGQRWTLLRAEGWDDFVERLSGLVAELEPRRRQVLVMLLFALVDGCITPEDAKAYVGEHDIDTDEGVEAMLAWLRTFRPRAADEGER